MRHYSILLAPLLLSLTAATPALAQKEDEKPGRPQNLTDEQRGQIFQRMDRNKDGKLSKTEVPERAWERLSRADRDKDDYVSKEEWAAAAKALEAMQSANRGGGIRNAGGPTSVMQSFDENKDGQLAKDEVSEGMWAKISRLDIDKDGSVSRVELATAYSERNE